MSKFYELKKDTKSIYSEELAEIIRYLSKHGTLFCSEKQVKELYEEFSSVCYSAGWMTVFRSSGATDNQLLEEFAFWLDSYDTDE